MGHKLQFLFVSGGISMKIVREVLEYLGLSRQTTLKRNLQQ